MVSKLFFLFFLCKPLSSKEVLWGTPIEKKNTQSCSVWRISGGLWVLLAPVGHHRPSSAVPARGCLPSPRSPPVIRASLPPHHSIFSSAQSLQTFFFPWSPNPSHFLLLVTDSVLKRGDVVPFLLGSAFYFTSDPLPATQWFSARLCTRITWGALATLDIQIVFWIPSSGTR